MNMNWPTPGSPEELSQWDALQARVPHLYHALSADPRTQQAVVVIPSLTLDPRELQKVSGAAHYEERMLVNLMLLKQPRTRVCFVTSMPVDPIVVDYYLAMLSGVPSSHARRRLTLLHCEDARNVPLTQKILERPRLIERIRRFVGNTEIAHMTCFNSTPLERSLAVRLGLPLHSVDPALADLGTKSGCRETFREAGIKFPFGFERLGSHIEMAEALAEIKKRDPSARKAVVKLNDGFSGEGNAIFRFGDIHSSGGRLKQDIYDALPTQLTCESRSETWDSFLKKYTEMQGVVESWVEGDIKRSPSAQCRVNGVGVPQVISSHDQVLGGTTGQVFLGCHFPAADEYRMDIMRSADQVAQVLAAKGVIGRFAVDYVSVKTPAGWDHFAIEVNLRKGGTTHPFLTLKFLTDGHLDPEDGLFYAPSGKPKYYFASDTIQEDRYRGLRCEDLMDIAVYHGLHFHGPTERGVVFHLIGALSEFGKLGMVAIGDNPQQARFLYDQALQVLDEETGKGWHPGI